MSRKSRKLAKVYGTIYHPETAKLIHQNRSLKNTKNYKVNSNKDNGSGCNCALCDPVTSLIIPGKPKFKWYRWPVSYI